MTAIVTRDVRRARTRTGGRAATGELKRLAHRRQRRWEAQRCHESILTGDIDIARKPALTGWDVD